MDGNDGEINTWYIEECGVDLIINDAPSHDFDRNPIALVYRGGDGTNNAALISAAPCLLSSAKKALLYLDSDDGHLTFEYVVRELESAILKAVMTN